MVKQQVGGSLVRTGLSLMDLGLVLCSLSLSILTWKMSASHRVVAVFII